MNNLVLLISYFLPKKIKYCAMLDCLDELPFGRMVIRDKNLKYTVVIVKEVSE